MTRVAVVALVLALLGCAEAHLVQGDDAGSLCPEPHPDCFTFLIEADREIPWIPRTDCTERPQREYYAMRPIHPMPAGSPCGAEGVCGQWGICEVAP